MISTSEVKYMALGATCTLCGLYIGFKVKERFFDKKTSDSDIIIQKSYERHPHLDRTIDAYVVGNSLREPIALRELREMTLAKFPGEPLIIDPLEAQLFQMLIHMLNAKTCMEVGALTGYNAANMALALPATGKVVVCDITSEYLDAGKPYIQRLGEEVWRKLDVQIKPALETMDHFINTHEQFDFIFLDAEWKTCMIYYEKALKLIRPGGIVAIDNTLCSGRVALPLEIISDDELREEVKALHEMNQKIKTDERIELVFLQMADGVTLCRKL